MARIFIGTLLMLFGVSTLAFAAGFIQGPFFYWADPFEADGLQLFATITGAAAFALGALTALMAFAKTRREAKPNDNS